MSWLGNLLKGTKPGAENLQAWISLDTCEFIQRMSQSRRATSGSQLLGLPGNHWDKQRQTCPGHFATGLAWSLRCKCACKIIKREREYAASPELEED